MPSGKNWVIGSSVDDMNDALEITITGAALTNIRWVASIDAVEVAYA